MGYTHSSSAKKGMNPSLFPTPAIGWRVGQTVLYQPWLATNLGEWKFLNSQSRVDGKQWLYSLNVAIFERVTFLCRDSNEKQAVTHRFLASNNVSGTHLLILYAIPMQCRWRLTVSLEIWKRSSNSPGVWLLSFSMAAFRTSSSKTCCRPLRGSSQRDRSPDLNIWNQFQPLSRHVVHSFTCQWSLLLTRCKNWQYLFLITL